jgi:PKD repeat protein
MPDGNNNQNQPQSQPMEPPKVPPTQSPQAAPVTPPSTPAVTPKPVVNQPQSQPQQLAQQQLKPQSPPSVQPSVQAQMSAAPLQKPTIMRPGVRPGVPVRKPPNPKRFIYGILSFFGCSIFLFIIFVVLFAAQTSSTGENALAKSLGLDTASFINTIITLVNVVFGFFAIVLFLVAIVGLFRIAMARKDDKEARKRGTRVAGVSGMLLIFMVMIWVGTYLFLSSKRVIIPKNAAQNSGIASDPENTLGLTAPLLIKFDGTKFPLDTRKYEILSFLWDFGDGETSTVQSPSHTYKDKGKNNGRYDVTVTVALREKANGNESTQEFKDIVTISNVKLNAQFKADPEKGPSPLTVEFDASDSSAPAGEIQNYEWDFDNNKTFTDARGVKVEHTFDQIGSYTVNLRITDNTGQFEVVSKEIVVEGTNLPTAVIEIPTTDGRYYSGTQYSFMAEKSSSPAGRIIRYEWDFGDQTPKATTRTATHIYKNAGNYEATLTVIDEKSNIGQSTQKISVETPVGAPLAAITAIPGPAKANDGFISGTVPFEVQFDGSKSSGDIVDYKWDFDGNGVEDAAGKQVNYVYKEAGSYNATLTVINTLNKQASTVLVIKVAPQGLKADLKANPADGVRPLTVTFDASGSSYPGGQIVSYEWDFGTGGPKRIDVSKVTYLYDQIGTFNAKVTAIASDGSRSTVTLPINVRPVPVKACFEPTVTQGSAPLTVEFNTRCSSGTIAKYNWNFGDGETSRATKPKHTFANPGSYEVKLEVVDSQNVVDIFSLNILVTGNVI